jgi:4,5-DOPA dioxygenase extradiol
MYAIEPGTAAQELQALGKALPKPKAILVVSAHWYTRDMRVATTDAPKTIHDFGGFPPALYRLQYPAKGHPEFAARAMQLLEQAGATPVADAQWGLDHGAWVPLRYLFPDADVPVFQVSLPAGMSGAQAIAYGQVLAPLASEGVLIIGSGSITHSFQDMGPVDAQPLPYVVEFIAWIRATLMAGDRDKLANTMELAPHAHRAHPSDDHFLPLLVAQGAGDANAPVTVLEADIRYGALSMESYVFGAIAH